MVSTTVVISPDSKCTLLYDNPLLSGCWSLQCDQGGASVVLRSLLWLGLVVYHVPNTPNFGYFYCGTGERNPDLLFML